MHAASVIVTTHNNESVIKRTLQSAHDAIEHLRQHVGGRNIAVETVVVDDGSTDGTKRIIEQLAERNQAYKLLFRDQSSSPGAARNAGVAASRGDLLFFLDGDDLFLDNHLSVCYDVLRDEEVGFVKTGVALSDPVHPEWRPRIAHTLVLNLCVRRRCHDFIGGFPDYHLCRRRDDVLVPELDIFYKYEDVYYNRLLMGCFRGIVSVTETVKYFRYPGNSFDQHYSRFQNPPSQSTAGVPKEKELQVRLCEVLMDHKFSELKSAQRRGPEGDERSER